MKTDIKHLIYFCLISLFVGCEAVPVITCPDFEPKYKEGIYRVSKTYYNNNLWVLDLENITINDLSDIFCKKDYLLALQLSNSIIKSNNLNKPVRCSSIIINNSKIEFSSFYNVDYETLNFRSSKFANNIFHITSENITKAAFINCELSHLQFDKFKKLITLDLSFNLTLKDTSNQLEKLSNLKELNIANTNIRQLNFNEMKSLRKLTVDSSFYEKNLSKLRSLENLSISVVGRDFRYRY